MKVTELKGACHVFTLADKSTFRIFPREEREVKDNLISAEMRKADGKYISLTPTPVKAKVPEAPVTEPKVTK